VLDISTLESHGAAFEIESMELAPLIAESLEANRPFVDKLGVELVFQGAIPGVVVRADGGRFVQLMTNLVVKAAKFSPAQGRVTVTMDVHDGWARASVRDDGPGIPESARATLFDRFTQVDSSNTRRHDGTGLGLAIARGIVQRLGGHIDLTSEVGVGSTFFFDLPTVDADASTPS
jgi:signal transduction histidine kinase